MTGFGKATVENEKWKVTVMIRSLNGKGLDISVRSPSFLLPLEQKIRDRIKKSVRRGTLHVFIEVESVEPVPPINEDSLRANFEVIKGMVEKMEVNVSLDLIFELAWKTSEKLTLEIDEFLEDAVFEALDGALKELIESRVREGSSIKKFLTERIGKIEEHISQLEKDKSRILSLVKEKVLEKAKELKLGEDNPTVLHEITFLLEKMDVEEEISRLKTHLQAFKRFLEFDEDVGKRLEFLAQEMHREINTLGSKIPQLSEYVVDIKTEIDRIKQQVANVE